MLDVAVISEGLSTTSHFISEKVSTILQKLGYRVEVISIGKKVWRTLYEDIIVDKNDFSIVRQHQKINFDCAYIYGEGASTKGWIQGYLSLLGIPYISSSPLTTLLATNKFFCKNYLSTIKIVSPKGIKVGNKTKNYTKHIIENIGFPCIVKPNIGTDSYLIEKVDDLASLEKAINTILDAGQEAIIEEFIEGRDITCGVIPDKNGILPTPITEIIVPEGEFYSYDVKLKRRSKKRTPARLSKQQKQQCQELTLKIYQALECEGFIRVDYVLKEGIFYFLEVNITPGLSDRSNLPLQLKAMKQNLETVFLNMIESKMIDTKTSHALCQSSALSATN